LGYLGRALAKQGQFDAARRSFDDGQGLHVLTKSWNHALRPRPLRMECRLPGCQPCGPGRSPSHRKHCRGRSRFRTRTGTHVGRGPRFGDTGEPSFRYLGLAHGSSTISAGPEPETRTSLTT
jgi:hypothetical protein